MLFSFLSVLPGFENQIKLIFILSAFTFYYMMIFRLKPYKLKVLNDLERKTWYVLIITFLGGFIILQLKDDLSPSSRIQWNGKEYNWLRLVAMASIALANFLYFVDFTRLFYFSLKENPTISNPREILQKVSIKAKRFFTKKQLVAPREPSFKETSLRISRDSELGQTDSIEEKKEV